MLKTQVHRLFLFNNFVIPGFVKVRCVDDPSAFCRPNSPPKSHPDVLQEGDEEEGEETEDAIADLPRNFHSRRPSREYNEPLPSKPLLTLPSSIHQHAGPRRNSFDVLMEEGEDMDGPEEGFMANLGRMVGPQFGPSDQQLARERSPLLKVRHGVEERRPSGVGGTQVFQRLEQKLEQRHQGTQARRGQTSGPPRWWKVMLALLDVAS